MATSPEDPDALRARLAGSGPGVLLPPRIAGTVRFEEVPAVRDLLALPGGPVIAVLATGDEVVVAPLVPGHGDVRRALAGDGAFAGIVEVIRRGERIGRFVPTRSRPIPEIEGERPIEVDQSNDSVVVGERVVVKLFPRTAPGPQPGIDLPAHLAEVGFDETPAPFGALRWEAPDAEPVLLATVAAYLPGARDGWDRHLELALDAVDGGDEEPSLAAAERSGSLVARLHAALASPSSVLGPSPVGEAGPSEVAAWRARAETTLDEALALTGGAEGTRLRAMATRARRELAALDTVRATPTMRIHGDLHVGQVLWWEGGAAVADFDGNPLAPAGERSAPQPAARDVASFVRSLDHLGRLAQRRRPGRDEVVEAWIGRARMRFLAAYRATLGELRLGRVFDERLLRPLEVAQECHEYVYAARYLPRWLAVPDLAMPRLLGEGSR